MYSIGFDIGSSSVKAALVETSSGKSIAVVHEPANEMDIYAPQVSWAEQQPDMWWKHVCAASNRLLSENDIDAKQVKGIGISYQMHGLVVVDKTGTPLRNAIIWCDSRAVSIGEKAFSDLGVVKCMGHLLNSPANFTASKLKWVHDNEPAVYEKIHKYMLPGDYIAYKFSGLMRTTANGLSEGTLWDYKENKAADWLLDYYGLDRSLTPEIVSNFSSQGNVDKAGAKASGLAVGTPIMYRAGDQPNNALSLNVLSPGEVAATAGTSGVVYALTDKTTSQEPERINHFAHVNYTKTTPTVGKLLCINGSGIQYRWMKNNSGNPSYPQMNQLAAQEPIGSNGLLVLPFGNGAERMLHNKNVGAQFVNIDLNTHHSAAMYRAVLEGIAFSFVYGMEIMAKDQTEMKVIRAGNDNLFQSEVFSNTIATLVGQEIELYNTTGAVGAARAVSLNQNDLKAFGAAVSQHDYVSSFTPLANKAQYQEAYQEWKAHLQTILTHKHK